jgi:hypothetical protein
MKALGGKGSLTEPRSTSTAPAAWGINADHRCLEHPAPLGDLSCDERGTLLMVLSVSECDGVKALSRTTDINTDDDWTRISMTHYGPCLAVNAYLRRFLSKIICNQPELFEGGFEVVDDFLGDDVGVGKIGGVF